MSRAKEYESLADIVKAKRNGTLPDTFQMWIDNDCTGATVEPDATVYRGPGPEEMLFEALEILGIDAVPV